MVEETRCAFPSCGIAIPRHRLMCNGHWHLVPKPLQKTIVHLWNNGRVRDGYREARESAIQQAQSRLRRMERGDFSKTD